MKRLRSVLAIVAIGTALFFAACGRKEVPISTGNVFPASMAETQFRLYAGTGSNAPSFTPDKSYAVVSSAWLPGFYERFRADLHSKGVVKWEGRFDCNKFAAFYCALAQVEFYRDHFHSGSQAQALAVAEIWYKPEYGLRSGDSQGHAIVAAITEQGVAFIEPQTGSQLKLSSKELASIYFKRF